MRPMRHATQAGHGRAQRGFTMVELMIVALIMVILSGGVMVLFLTGRQSYLSADAFIVVQQEARKAFDNMVRELRESGNINIPAGNVRRLDFQVARGYNLAAPCPANAICWGNENAANEWVHYVITGNTQSVQLVRCLSNARDTVFADYSACRVLAQYVDSSTDGAGNIRSRFTWDAVNQTVVLSLQIRYANPGIPDGFQQAAPVPLVARVRLRNT